MCNGWDIGTMLRCWVLVCVMLYVCPIQLIKEVINQSPLLSENLKLLSCVLYDCQGIRLRKQVSEDTVRSFVEMQRDFTLVMRMVNDTTVENRHGERSVKDLLIPPCILFRN